MATPSYPRRGAARTALRTERSSHMMQQHGWDAYAAQDAATQRIRFPIKLTHKVLVALLKYYQAEEIEDRNLAARRASSTP